MPPGVALPTDGAMLEPPTLSTFVMARSATSFTLSLSVADDVPLTEPGWVLVSPGGVVAVAVLLSVPVAAGLMLAVTV